MGGEKQRPPHPQTDGTWRVRWSASTSAGVCSIFTTLSFICSPETLPSLWVVSFVVLFFTRTGPLTHRGIRLTPALSLPAFKLTLWSHISFVDRLIIILRPGGPDGQRLGCCRGNGSCCCTFWWQCHKQARGGGLKSCRAKAVRRQTAATPPSLSLPPKQGAPHLCNQSQYRALLSIVSHLLSSFPGTNKPLLLLPVNRWASLKPSQTSPGRTRWSFSSGTEEGPALWGEDGCSDCWRRQKRCFSAERCCKCRHRKNKRTSLGTRLFFSFFSWSKDRQRIRGRVSSFGSIAPEWNLCLKTRCSKTEDTKNRIFSKMTHFFGVHN